jgi:transcriptional regulator with XRE-family HTH domain
MALTKSKTRPQKNSLGRRIDVERKKLGYSLQQLATRAGYNERTIRNFIKGKATRFSTKNDICSAVGIDIQKETASKRIQAADAEHGSYNRDHFREYIGCFFAYRRSFQVEGNLIRSLYEFFWSNEPCCLRFREAHRYYSPRLKRLVNYDQEGDVFVSNSIGLVHLLTKYEGALRLITLTKLHHDEMTMSGIVVTQTERPNHFEPAASAIYLRKVKSGSPDELIKQVGPMEPGDPDFKAVESILEHVEKAVACMAVGSRA